ncbi:diguanylate cyclase [Clostridium sp. AM58-1XD]|uniref:GGDEF domain-containing response regulator n=1 Tax=Clostridium sp. AM58-1XD TaxID=2292307 RepID=UPI000E4A61D7|nr:diguanylate cyclase [Clostridium sp. AM58-1XD]RGY96859.1 diguanylate cyclase [Clostridium sp. AM58-1XD]
MADGQTVLVVDDSLLICRQIEIALKTADISLYQSHTGAEALKMIENIKPDLILLDVVLPDMEGYELMERMKDKDHVAVVFITSKDREEDVVRGFALGACDYIKKPFQTEEMKSRVLAHLETKKKRDELERLNETFRADMEKLSSMVYREELTGLYNRRYVIETMAGKLKNSDRQNFLVMVDIDDFKKVNDNYGHDAGDTALICIASLMNEICHSHVVTRWGGEEFLIILTDIDVNTAWDLCEEMRREVEDFQFVHGDTSFFCTITLGIAEYDRKADFKSNIRYADKALYMGKSAGKNRTVRYEPGSECE